MTKQRFQLTKQNLTKGLKMGIAKVGKMKKENMPFAQLHQLHQYQKLVKAQILTGMVTTLVLKEAYVMQEGN